MASDEWSGEDEAACEFQRTQDELPETTSWGLPQSSLSEDEKSSLSALKSRLKLDFSKDVEEALLIAAGEGAFFGHAVGLNWIDCQTLFFGLLSVGLQEREGLHHDHTLLSDLAIKLGFDQKRLEEAKTKYASQIKLPSIAPEGIVTLGLEWDEAFLELWLLAQRIKYQCTVAGDSLEARHLVAGLIQFAVERTDVELKQSGFWVSEAVDALVRNCYLHEENDSREGWADFFARFASERFKNGQNNHFNREGNERQLALRIDDYADALADFFKSAGSGECCLALFAPWGRGKSFLMKRVGNKLGKIDYETIFFQAWKYPTRPEVWVHLYETISRTAFSCPWWQKWPRVFRTGVARQGFGPLVWALLTLSLATYPKLHFAIEAWSWLQAAITTIGVGSFIWLIIFFSRVGQSAKKLSKEYLLVPNHGEKLGLQATIGDDLAALLEGWMPNKSWPGLFPAMGFTVTLCLMFEGAEHWGSFLSVGLFAGTWRFGAMLPWLAISLLLLLGFWLFSRFREPKRILLVVDDLDRCSMEHLVAVMESIKLLIEDKSVSRRIQVAMLVEEEVLKQAILQKYSDIRVGNGGTLTDERIVRESWEKLFTVHLRLGPLDLKDAEEVLIRLFDSFKPEKEKVKEEKAQSTNANDASSLERSKPLGALAFGDHTREDFGFPLPNSGLVLSRSKPFDSSNLPEKKLEVGDETFAPCFSRVEEGFLVAAIKVLVNSRGADVVGPRAIRNFVFRYQMGRLLLNRLQIKFEPQALTRALVSAITHTHPDYPVDDHTLRVVRQIS